MHVDTRTVTSVALAVACVVAVAAAADGFDSLSTDPEDLVDPEFDRLPVGQGELESLRDEVVAREGTGDTRPKPDESSEGSASRGTSEESAAESAAESSGEREASAEVTTQAEAQDQAESQDQSAANQQRTTRSESASDGPGDQPPPPPPDERDWWLLLALLAALAVAGAFAYRYVDRFRSDDADAPPFGDANPDSEVERAWLNLVRRVDADRPETRTPGEWAARAVDSGLDADAVATLTRAFESVRYGGGEETEERRRRVRRALDRLDARYGTDGGERTDGGEPGGADR